MARALSVCLIVLILGYIAYGLITLYDTYMPAGRMWQTPGIKPYEDPIPVMALGSVPVSGGEVFIKAAADKDLAPPFSLTDPEVVNAGKIGYQYYCIQCHGQNHDGYGTVGQSFAPTPADLRGKKVQDLLEGTFFKEISYGFAGGRQPPLDTTMSPEDRWRVIAYIKNLGLRE
jgi:mono/diheme cytochrome c family protein